MKEPIISDDYAVLEAGGFTFYYGYETAERDDDGQEIGPWMFEVRSARGIHIQVTARDLGYPQFTDPSKVLLAGIGYWLDLTHATRTGGLY